MADEETNLSPEAGDGNTQQIQMEPKADEPVESTVVPQKDDDVNIEDDDDDEDKPFGDSTHGYLIYGFDSGSRDINSLIMGGALWVSQMVLYSLLMGEAAEAIAENQVEVTVGGTVCNRVHTNGNGKIGKYNVENNIMTCADPGDGSGGDTYNIILPATLLAINLQPDFVQCLSFIFSRKSHTMKKIMSAIVLSEGFFGLLTGLVWCWQGIYKGSGYDAIVNSIGVLFVHDMDEQLFASIQALNGSPVTNLFHKVCKEGCCCHNFAACACTGLFGLFVILMAFFVDATMYGSYDDVEATGSEFYASGDYPVGYYQDGFGTDGFVAQQPDWYSDSLSDQFDFGFASGGDASGGGASSFTPSPTPDFGF